MHQFQRVVKQVASWPPSDEQSPSECRDRSFSYAGPVGGEQHGKQHRQIDTRSSVLIDTAPACLRVAAKDEGIDDILGHGGGRTVGSRRPAGRATDANLPSGSCRANAADALHDLPPGISTSPWLRTPGAPRCSPPGWTPPSPTRTGPYGTTIRRRSTTNSSSATAPRNATQPADHQLGQGADGGPDRHPRHRPALPDLPDLGGSPDDRTDHRSIRTSPAALLPRRPTEREPRRVRHRRAVHAAQLGCRCGAWRRPSARRHHTSRESPCRRWWCTP